MPQTEVIQHTSPTPYPVGDVHLYECRTAGHRLLVDTGPPGDGGRAVIDNLLAAGTFDAVLVTHCHPDHFGQLDYLASQGVPVVVSQYDRWKFTRIEERVEALIANLTALGCPADVAASMGWTIRKFQRSIPFPQEVQVLEESRHLLDRWGVDYRRCAGHSQSDIVYLVGDSAISGDVLLRDIFQTPLLEVDLDRFSGRFSNYEAYCRTLVELHDLRDYRFCPGHRIDLDSIDERILYYVGKVLERATLAAPRWCAGESVYAMAKGLLPGFTADDFYGYMKISELAFLADFLNNPAPLRQSLKALGLWELMQRRFEEAVTC